MEAVAALFEAGRKAMRQPNWKPAARPWKRSATDDDT
jgi:hypothetical protein